MALKEQFFWAETSSFHVAKKNGRENEQLQHGTSSKKRHLSVNSTQKTQWKLQTQAKPLIGHPKRPKRAVAGDLYTSNEALCCAKTLHSWALPLGVLTRPSPTLTLFIYPSRSQKMAPEQPCKTAKSKMALRGQKRPLLSLYLEIFESS